MGSSSDEEGYGAPTRFYDPPTGQSYDVYPRPGRVVLMDQDITHTVVAPNVSAGERPRYSLVWKLILHPSVENQNMQYWGNDDGRVGGLIGSGEDGVILVGSAADTSH